MSYLMNRSASFKGHDGAPPRSRRAAAAQQFSHLVPRFAVRPSGMDDNQVDVFVDSGPVPLVTAPRARAIEAAARRLLNDDNGNVLVVVVDDAAGDGPRAPLCILAQVPAAELVARERALAQ